MMRKFLKHIIIFSGIVLFIAASVGSFNYLRMRKSPDLGNTQILLMGDSRVMTGINPELITNSRNIAQNSESYFITYYKLKAIFKNTNNVKKIILGFSYHNFSAYVDNIFKNDIATEDIFKRIYPIIKPNDFGEMPVDKYKYYQIILKQLLIYPHLDHQKYMGTFEPLPYGLNKASLSSVILRHYYDKDSNNIGTSCCSANYLDSIIQLTKEKNIELVLVNIPLQKDYLAQIPSNFVKYYNSQKEKMQQKGVKVLDYSDVELPDQYFKDYNHLDFEGASFFTEMLKNDLAN